MILYNFMESLLISLSVIHGVRSNTTSLGTLSKANYWLNDTRLNTFDKTNYLLIVRM